MEFRILGFWKDQASLRRNLTRYAKVVRATRNRSFMDLVAGELFLLAG